MNCWEDERLIVLRPLYFCGYFRDREFLVSFIIIIVLFSH